VQYFRHNLFIYYKHRTTVSHSWAVTFGTARNPHITKGFEAFKSTVTRF